MDCKWLASKEFEEKYSYDGQLGCLYSKEKTRFVLWAPTAREVYISFYGTDTYENPAKKTEPMYREERGIWTLEIEGDLKGEFYTYLVNVENKINEIVDPYAKAVSVNGKKAMVVDLAETNPQDWNNDKRVDLKSPTDAVIYEVHIRDLTMDADSTLENELRGKYKGFVKENTTLKNTNVKTGFDHIKELGITHVHLLPSFDYGSIDEKDKTYNKYNWGYDPENYNVPEGSYATNPYAGNNRIREFKEMVKKLHQNNIGVIMDVVYNHTYNLNSCLNGAVPGYYYRQDEDGNYSDGAGCGNETASDRYMFRKYMIDSVVYWAKEYHIDGFRFDLMGLHDIETMKQIRLELDKISPKILMYGEGWTCNESPLDRELAALKDNTYKYGDMQIAAFSDDARDVIKGKVFYDDSVGFVNGGQDLEETMKFMITASTKHPEVDVSKGMYSNTFWANEPYQTVTYDSAHDNYTLFDKLRISLNDDIDEEELIRMNKLVAASILTSQGIVFLHAGEELARSKRDKEGTLVHNSFDQPDDVNKIIWQNKVIYKELFEYYKGLIQIRKNMKSFRMETNKDIIDNLHFLETDKNVIAYTINSAKLRDRYDKAAVILNAKDECIEVDLGEEDWQCIANENIAGLETIKCIEGSKVVVPRKSAYILVK